MMQKSIKIFNNSLTNSKFFIYSLHNKNILISQTQLGDKYILIPDWLTIVVEEKKITLSSKKFHFSQFQNFEIILKAWMRNILRLSRKRLYLKGLGYKVSISNDKNNLILKLGYSNISEINIPKESICVKINKTYINIEGFNPVDVGNFANKIRKLRIPDNYKGKGIWYKNEFRALKELKKK